MCATLNGATRWESAIRGLKQHLICGVKVAKHLVDQHDSYYYLYSVTTISVHGFFEPWPRPLCQLGIGPSNRSITVSKKMLNKMEG
jgi:hypothetical protein